MDVRSLPVSEVPDLIQNIQPDKAEPPASSADITLQSSRSAPFLDERDSSSHLNLNLDPRPVQFSGGESSAGVGAEGKQLESSPSYPALASTAIKATIKRLHDLVSNAVVATEAAPQNKTATMEKEVPKTSTPPYVSSQVAKLEEIIQAESRRSSEQVSSDIKIAMRQSPFPADGGSPVVEKSDRTQWACAPDHHLRKGLKSAPAAPILSPAHEIKQQRHEVADKLPSNVITHTVTDEVPAKATESGISVADFAYPKPSDVTDSVQTSLDVISNNKPQLSPRHSRSSTRYETSPDLTSLITRPSLRRQSSLIFPPSLTLNGEPFVDDEQNSSEAIHDLHPPKPGHERHFSEVFGINSRRESLHTGPRYSKSVDLSRCNHVDLPGGASEYDDHKSCHHSPVARNWPIARKRLSAAVACINLSCTGLILGLFAGEVPAIQYVIIDEHRLIILGNVALYLGLAIAALTLWPLPLLHGRKPYTIGGLSLTLCLQIPQGIAVGTQRLPDNTLWMSLLLVSRAMSGIALGLCDINVHATLLDLFGASLQSQYSDDEILNPYDVRRHGGGMGLWLGIWSWCSIGPISLGFTIGAFIINNADSVAWGFWLALLILMIVLLLNIVTPEVRRSAFRRTMAEFKSPDSSFSRVARGEVKMHLDMEGPSWWGEEALAGLRLCMKMLGQLGFFVLSLYSGWVYAQFTLILMLLGALASQTYEFRAVHVGLCVLSLAIGALLATPFQKASWLSRARRRAPTSASMTVKQSWGWSSHLVRRTLFTIILPLMAIAYTFTSHGPPFHIAAPCVMAGLVGFFSAIALAECCSLILETFDTSDLQPGMNGRLARHSVLQRCGDQRTNFSCYPRVSAGIALSQTFKYVLAAAATGVGGRVERRLGAMKAAGVVAGVLLGLTFMFTIVLFRWRKVQLVPESRRRHSRFTRSSTWEPAVMGKPESRIRNVSILEAGRMSRWWEIRQRNMLNVGLTGG